MAYKVGEGKRLYRTKEAARYLALSARAVRKLAQDGKLPIVQEGEGAPWRFDVHDLDSHVERSKRLVM